jgi:hypothetical protein
MDKNNNMNNIINELKESKRGQYIEQKNEIDILAKKYNSIVKDINKLCSKINDRRRLEVQNINKKLDGDTIISNTNCNTIYYIRNPNNDDSDSDSDIDEYDGHNYYSIYRYIDENIDNNIIENINLAIQKYNKTIESNINSINKYNTHIEQYKKILSSNNTLFANDIFDKTPSENCCNVVAITLYLSLNKNNHDQYDTFFNNASKYILSIYRTVKNVETDLKGWIVRVYFDDSVYCTIKKFIDSNDIKYQSLIDSFNYINNSDIVEIYIYDCPDDTDNKYFNRMLRFLPFIEKDVNTCICRDADGIVSRLDCHNIKVFSNSDKLFYLAFNWTHPYSGWIQRYIITKYISHNKPSPIQRYDLLAGAFGINLRVKTNHYNNGLNIMHNYHSDEHLHDDYLFAYDECLLYELFIGYANINTEIRISLDNEDKLLDILEKKLFISKLNIDEQTLIFNSEFYKNNTNNTNIHFIINNDKLGEYFVYQNKINDNFNDHDFIFDLYTIDAIIDIDKLDQKTAYNIIYKSRFGDKDHLILLNVQYDKKIFDLLYDFGQLNKTLNGGNIFYNKTKKYLIKNQKYIN